MLKQVLAGKAYILKEKLCDTAKHKQSHAGLQVEDLGLA